jgi:maltooligosyltrehalose trehalohydrolase
VGAQNHDQVGNRAVGDRMPADALHVAAAVTLFAPTTPLLFMGEEYGERNPFQFFTDHVDPEIAELTREGRKQEFAEFAGFAAADVPDPQDLQTFERSKLVRAAGDEELRELYRRLLALRRKLPREVAFDADESNRMLRVRRGNSELVLNFSEQKQEGIPARGVELRA